MRERYYFDPIYNQIVIPKHTRMGAPDRARALLLTGGIKTEDVLESAVLKVLETDAFDRMSFLFQSGIAWLVFPSATHTRFAHSIGCYHLGSVALKSVKVMQSLTAGGETVESLSDWLSVMPGGNTPTSNVYFKAVFLASLLCHDVGHFPFSHTLEMNHDIDLEVTHEEQLFKLLSDDFYRFFEKISYPGITKDNFLSIFPAALKYLISGDPIPDDGFPVDCASHYIIRLKVLKKLVSGLLDLDRVDHYLRDSFFTGVKLANFNIEYLLRGMTFSVSSDATTFHLMLSRDGLIQAKNLLYSKEQLNDAVFENVDLINYEIILNACISSLIKGKPDVLQDVTVMEDWKLLNALESHAKERKLLGDEHPNDLFSALLKKRPLAFIGKFALSGNYRVDYDDNGDVVFQYENDVKLLDAVRKFYTFALGADLFSEDSGVTAATSESIQTAKSLFDTNFLEISAALRCNPDSNGFRSFLSLILFPGLCQHIPAANELRKKILNNIDESALRRLHNGVKRDFVSRLRAKMKRDGDGLHFKFSRKFLQLHQLSGDVNDLSTIRLSDANRLLVQDPNEREFLRMFAGRDIKSRINVWIYSEFDLAQSAKDKLIRDLETCGFEFVRGAE